MSYSVLSCVSLRFYPLLSGIVAWHRVFGFSALRFSGSPLLLCPSALSCFPALCVFPLFLSSSLLCRFSFLLTSFSLSLFPSAHLTSAFSLPCTFLPRPFSLVPSPCSLPALSLLSPCSLPALSLLSPCSLPAPPHSEPDRRAAGIYFAAAFLVVAFLAAGFFAVFASSFTAVLAGDFRAAGSFSTFASALTALLRVVFFFGSGVPALRA